MLKYTIIRFLFIKTLFSVAPGSFRKQSSEMLKSKPPSGDPRLPPTGIQKVFKHILNFVLLFDTTI